MTRQVFQSCLDHEQMPRDFTERFSRTSDGYPQDIEDRAASVRPPGGHRGEHFGSKLLMLSRMD
jgi:hypothetical protein